MKRKNNNLTRKKLSTTSASSHTILEPLAQQIYEITGHLPEHAQSLEEYAKYMRNYLESIINSMPGNVFWMDTHSTFWGCNENVLKLMGLTREEYIGKTYDDLVKMGIWDADQVALIKSDDLKVIRTGCPTYNHEEPPLPSPNNGEVYYLTSRVPIKNTKQKVIGIVGISVDITDRKNAEIKAKQAEAATALAEAHAKAEEEMRNTVMVLVGDIVHDLRTPIATIRTVSNLLGTLLPSLFEIIEEAKVLGAKKTNILSKKEWEYLFNNTPITSLKNSVLMMDNFINSTLIELASAQKANHMKLTKDDLIQCSSRRIIENTLDAYHFENKIKIHKNISYDFLLTGNSILIIKILCNLISNAIE